jgi:hypothetical protein
MAAAGKERPAGGLAKVTGPQKHIEKPESKATVIDGFSCSLAKFGFAFAFAIAAGAGAAHPMRVLPNGATALALNDLL